MVKQLIKFNLKLTPSKTFHSTMGNAPNHTLHTNENRQHFPKWNILKYFFNLCAGKDNIFQNGIYCLGTSISFLFNIPFRKCHILVVVLVTKIRLFCWHVGPWWISTITFQYADNVIIHHPVTQTIIPMKNKSSTEMLVNIICEVFGDFNYFVLPQECSHIVCAHNLFSPAWYIDSCLYWDVKLVPSP
jgi:hypothetical protein